jgi:hypothetical protein
VIRGKGKRGWNKVFFTFFIKYTNELGEEDGIRTSSKQGKPSTKRDDFYSSNNVGV